MGFKVRTPVLAGYPVRRWSFTGDGTHPWGMDDKEIGVEELTPDVVLLSDPLGNCHENIRDLFRTFRLNACRCDRQTDQLLQLQRGLRALEIGMHRMDQVFMADDIFDGSRSYLEDYLYLLEHQGFATCAGERIADVELSKEGRAVLHMLDITAPGSNIDTSPRAIRRMRQEKTIPTR